MPQNKTPDEKTENNTFIISAPIVAKDFYKKNGAKTDVQEYYIRRSVQDYFIKFCEGKVLRKDLEEALAKIPGEMKSLKMEVEFRDGSWDICDDNVEQQSRIGKYVIIHKIL